MTFNKTSDVNAYISKFDIARAKLQKSSDGFALSSRKDLYTMLGEAKVACDHILSVANRMDNGEEVDAADLLHLSSVSVALKERQLRPAKAGANKYGPIIKMLFGSFDPGAKKVDFEGLKDLTKFNPNRSAEKYALVMHWFDMEKITSDFVGALENLDGKMDAAIKAASANLRPKAKPEDPKLVEERVKLLLNEDGYQVIDKLKLEVPEDQGKYGLLWFENVNGEVRVRGLYDGKSETIAKHVEAVAKEREPVLRDRVQLKTFTDQVKHDAYMEIAANPEILANYRAQLDAKKAADVRIGESA
ncbi:hypothetical protein [Sphingobium yanoikuyae]|uniref:hypothetical protein n=1 Tax=Sphingobium yanoikuyae TaxID=13690 RepID=UPI0031DF2B23